jgi:thiamine pyrophosphate-dependent acetolactate synthase large subunit-like protein
MPSVSAVIATTLSAHVHDVFGVMGNGNAYFLDALETTSTVFTPVRHEAAAVAAADAYFRACGRLAAATATYGAGFTNLITPLAEAVRARIPLVVIVGSAPESGMRDWDVDQTALASAVGAATITVDRMDAQGQTERAVALARSTRMPVVLAVPYDIGRASVADPDDAPTSWVADDAPTAPLDADEIAAAAAALAGAARPLILAGRGAWLAQAGEVLGELADCVGALTATSALGAGLFGDSPWNLGIAGGFGSHESAALMHEADVVLVVGARLNQFTMRFGSLLDPAATVIQIDTDPESRHPVTDLLLVGDAVDVGRALCDRLAEHRAITPWRATAGEVPHGLSSMVGEVAVLEDARLDPRNVFQRLDRALPLDRVVVQDGGHFIGWAPGYLRIPAPNRLIMVGTALQTIGLGFASGVGAAVAAPDSTIVLATGDGGGLMALSDLQSFIAATRRGVVIVVNDAGYGAEMHQYGSKGLSATPMLIDDVDFAAVGSALGAHGLTVRTLDDLDALERWLADGSDGVWVVDCKVSQSIIAPYMREIMVTGM